MFLLACADVLPGCAALFESIDRDELLSAVARHAAEAHRLVLTPDILDTITSRIVTG